MKKYKNYYEARAFARSLNLKSARKWKEYCSGHKLDNIPTNPARTYTEWIDWNDWLDNHNVSGGNIKYEVNDNFFKVWSPNMAYILGFWWADGFISTERNLFVITQSPQNKEILEKIKIEMDYSGHLKCYESRVDLKITSKQIINDIKLLGGMDRKSHKIGFPNKLPNIYIPDFVRGYFDGDGTIYFNSQCKAYMSAFASGSVVFIEKLANTLRENINNLKGGVYRIGQTQNYNLQFGVNDTKRLKGFIYKKEDCLKMERKYLLFSKLGEIVTASFDKKFCSYNESKQIALDNNIQTMKEWESFVRIHKSIGEFLIPSDPSTVYRGEWKGSKHFLETNFWEFEKALKYVRSLEIKGAEGWKKFAGSPKRPKNIPSNPWTAYKNEWINLPHWLGI